MAIKFAEEDEEKLKNSDAEIYRKRTKETNEEDIRNLSKWGKVQHFVQYYLKSILLIALVVIVVGTWLFQSMFGSKIPVLYVAMEKDVFDEEKIAAFQEELEKYFKVDDRECVVVDTSCSRSQLQTYLYAGKVDVVITGKDTFLQWAKAQYFMDTVHNKEVSFYKNYKKEERITSQYISSKDVRNNITADISETKPSDPTQYECGISLEGDRKYEELGGFLEKPVAGISVNSAYADNAKRFIEYMKR